MATDISTAEEIQHEIVTRLAEQAGVQEAEVDVDGNLFTSGLVDSGGMMRLLDELEERLGVEVPPPDLVPENFRTVAVMAGYLAGLRASSVA